MIKIERVEQLRDDGTRACAHAPAIVSASIVTDIPAYHGGWFIRRLQAGYAVRTNAFSRKKMHVSFKNARLIVFWTKNPAPLMPRLKDIDEMRLGYYFHFTLNDYEREGLEPGLPALERRIETFQALSRMIGKKRVIWRFDPLVLAGGIGCERLVEKLEGVARRLEGFTEKLVFKFAAIDRHRKVARRLTREGVAYRDFSREEVFQIAAETARIARCHGMEARSCMEAHELSGLGVQPNRCVDPGLIRGAFAHDAALLSFVERCEGKNRLSPLKNCNCLPHTDVGEYNTCLHLCRYCYANLSDQLIQENFNSRLSGDGESMLE
jgi:DNA repair photolyase